MAFLGPVEKWQPGDDPWVVHAQFYPGCSFIRVLKGDQYIASVQLEQTSTSESQRPTSSSTVSTSFAAFKVQNPSIRDGVLRSGMLLYLHHRDSKIYFHPAKFDNFKDEKISDFKTVSVSQRKNLLD